MLERTQQGTLDITPWMQWFLACLGRAFAGNLTSQKWATLAKCSHDTALRDIQSLMELGLLKKDSCGGRSRVDSMAQRESLLCDIAPHEECR